MSSRYYARKVLKLPSIPERTKRTSKTEDEYIPSPIATACVGSQPELFEKPFRWNIACRKQLGNLLDGEYEPMTVANRAELKTVCAQIVALAGGADLVFVGRSLENAYDYLCGTGQQRAFSIAFSMRYSTEGVPSPSAMAAYREYLRHLGLLPEQIAVSGRRVVFADIVASGSTFHSLIALLKRFADEAGVDWNAVRRKIRLVGLVRREETSPKTWRWQQHSPWLTALLGSTNVVKNISLSPALYHYCADYQSKTIASYPPKAWGIEYDREARYTETQLKALRLAHQLFLTGRKKRNQKAFGKSVAQYRFNKMKSRSTRIPNENDE